jgi:hypothetical protein
MGGCGTEEIGAGSIEVATIAHGILPRERWHRYIGL